MVVRTIGDVKTEDFILSKGLHVHIDYGVISYDDGHYYPAFERYSGSKRRSQLLDDKGNIISEVIESNPDELTYEKEKSILATGLKIGDEFERVINFPNGYVAKIEYWVTPLKRDKNFGRYDAKYQKKILLDEKDNIISEVMDYNPYYMDSNVEVIQINSEDIDFD